MVQNPRYDYTLVLKDHGSDISLKAFVNTIQYEETGNDEISNAIIVLNAHFGRWIKNNIVIGGVTYPKINFFDRIYLKITDPDGNSVEDVLEVLKKIPYESSTFGDSLEIQCSNQGWHFAQVRFADQILRASGFDVVKTICDDYNVNLGPKDPTIEKHDQVYDTATRLGNAMSKATFNDYDWGNVETYCVDGVNDTIDKLGSSVDAGGELNFFDFRFVPKYNHALNQFIDIMQLSIAVSGQVNSKVTISKADSVAKITDTRGELEPLQGSNIMAVGDPNGGSLPTNFAIYFGQKEKFFSALDWVSGLPYLAGMRVQYNGHFYLCLSNVTSGTNPASDPGHWQDQGNVFTTATVDYSPYTKNKPQYWINSGAGYIFSRTPTQNDATQFDHNIVIQDTNHRRTWVDIIVTNPASIPADMLIGGLPFRTLRVLCRGTPAGVFAQNGSKDRFGVSYQNAVIKHNGGVSGTYQDWDVFQSPQNDLEVVEKRTGFCWIWNHCGGILVNGSCILGSRDGAWTRGAYISGQLGGNDGAIFVSNGQFDCLHPYDIDASAGPHNPQFGNEDGIEGGSGTPGDKSAVYAQYTFTNNSLHSVGGWLNLMYPIPRCGNSTAWGASNVGEQYLPPTLDVNNMRLNHLGGKGLNQGLPSEDLMPLSALRFFLNITAKNLGGFLIQQGDFKVRVAIGDSSDNVVVADSGVVAQNDNRAEITIPVTDFRIFRGRSGLPFLPLQEIEILNIFEWRNINWITIETLDSYDDQGRYNAFNRFVTELGNSIKISCDGFHWVKPLMCVSQEVTNPANKPDRNLEPQTLQRPNISNYMQLKNDVLSMLQIYQFQRVEYQVSRALRCNIRFGQMFTLNHPRLVDENGSSSVDLVCKKNIYTISKGKGTGGFLMQTIGVKRFTSLT